MPGVDALIVTAICPHTLAVRPIVVRAGAEISIVQAPPFEEEALVSYDGQVGAVLAPGKTITMRTADSCVKLVRVGREGFFTRVREKLRWGDLDDRERT